MRRARSIGKKNTLAGSGCVRPTVVVAGVSPNAGPVAFPALVAAVATDIVSVILVTAVTAMVVAALEDEVAFIEASLAAVATYAVVEAIVTAVVPALMV
ncbi:hypothetical protein NDU88_004283 [Pleurodeles waltl]|uniref:Uncharacterized protein n=1 Tax=Pleurodeles waltl TaxID=8319 RepID=A0AAV7PH04_PLEWA|nr:hypothetical protein NDU88_004283 [Pleurodeles waltl]